ncbi:MAG: M28 family peptidase [Ginsengibacter sp.]
MKNIFILLLLFSQVTTAQKIKKQEKIVIEDLKTSINYLASDQLEGRLTGSPGEKLAYEFISGEFKKVGLVPKGDGNSYLQPFTIEEGKEILPSTHFMINDTDIDQNEFFPMAFSGNGEVKGDVSPSFQEKGMPWFWNIKEIVQENQNNPHFDLKTAIRNKAVDCKQKGATALIVYNPSESSEDLSFDGKSKTETIDFPIVYLKKDISKKYLSDNTTNLNIDVKTALGNKSRTGHNVIGFMDNGAAHTIIIGAHYDHLGRGEEGGTLGGSKGEIYNGADDNASGTAAVIELAKYLKDAKLKNNNYLFICFSGEEEGLFGSKYFTNNSAIPLDQVNYMINFDMVGRLNDSSKLLIIGGFGTSPFWGKILPEKSKVINVKLDSSGIGPSDHTSFYLKNIPVLFFFTGTHKDYHRPTDDADKINFVGEFRVIQYVENILKETNSVEKIAFSKTREPDMSTAHFTVTLGFMPDYTFQGSGVRADEIIDGKIAQKAGMKAGDVIVKLGEYPVTDINNYMEALSKFKKGDSTNVTILRGSENKIFNVEFN